MADARQHLMRIKRKGITDARQLLQLKHAANHRKNMSPMNCVTPMRSDSFQQNRPTQMNRKFPPTKQFRTNGRGFSANNRMNANRRFSNQRSFSNRQTFPNTNDFRNRHTMSRNSNTVQRRPRGVSRLSARGRTSSQSSNFRTFTRPNTSNADKHVIKTQQGITVTRKNLQRNFVKAPLDGEDELEQMALEDLPGLQHLPRGLHSKPPVMTSNRPTSSHSSFSSFLSDTMVADRYTNSHGSTKLMVTGLLPSVSEADIIELFENIGPLVSIENLSPGKVLVQYASASDAETAAENYNGILLDGQAMKCHILQSVDSRNSLASRLGEKPSATISQFQYQLRHSPFMVASSQSDQDLEQEVKFTVSMP